MRTEKKKVLTTIIILLSIVFITTENLFAENVIGGNSSSELANVYQMTFRDVAKKTLPVVCEINVVNIVKTKSFPDAFDFFFGNSPLRKKEENPNEKDNSREFRRQGLGSGVIVRHTGKKVYILTNHHVVNGADEISVRLYDGREFDAELVGSDPRRDIALIMVKTNEDVPIAKLGDSDDIYVGDWVFAVGNPMGFEATFTGGLVSAVEREADISSDVSFTDYIQTDAAINPGNSGGALVNLKGEVVGINSWIATQSGGSNGLGFAIPINNAKKAIDDFIDSGSVVYGWLGVNVMDLVKDSKSGLNLEGIEGAFINDVFIDSPADEGGLLPGDYIIKVGNSEIQSRNDLVKVIGNLPPNRWVSFEFYRDGKKNSLSLKLGKRDEDEISSNRKIDVWPGLSIVEATEEVRKALSLETNKGNIVVANVQKGSPAETAGLRSGDIILRVDNKRIKTLSDFYSTLNEMDEDEVMLRIYRGNREAIIGIVK